MECWKLKVVMKGMDAAREEEWKGRERWRVEEERMERERWRRNLINLSFCITFFFDPPKNPGPIFLKLHPKKRENPLLDSS